MTSPYAMFGTSKDIETKGITLDFGDFIFHIARAGGSNKKYTKAMERIFKKHRKALQTGTLPPEVQNKLMIEVFAESVVLGWTGVVDAEGNEMPFNKENVVKLFTDLPELFQQVLDDAQNFQLFKEEENNDIAGN